MASRIRTRGCRFPIPETASLLRWADFSPGPQQICGARPRLNVCRTYDNQMGRMCSSDLRIIIVTTAVDDLSRQSLKSVVRRFSVEYFLAAFELFPVYPRPSYTCIINSELFNCIRHRRLAQWTAVSRGVVKQTKKIILYKANRRVQLCTFQCYHHHHHRDHDHHHHDHHRQVIGYKISEVCTDSAEASIWLLIIY